MTKKEARDFYLKKRQALSDAELEELNFRIQKNVLYSDYFASAETIHIYLSIERVHEPDTWRFLSERKRFVTPRINEYHTLDHFYYEGFHQLKKNQFGILEPVEGVAATADELDLVLVPLAAYDVEGNRVGYGKGFYDRFLKDCRPDCIKAGLSFFEPAEKFSDVEEHDVPLDICFTPERVYKF